MTKTNVGGADGLIDKLLIRMGWQASSNTADDQRKRALAALDLCEKMISQTNGLEYRRTRSTFSLNAGTDRVAVPSDMDTGVDFAIEHPAGHGKIEVLPPDKFAAEPSAIPYDRIDTTPVKCMVAIDHGDLAKKIIFRFANGSGGNFIYPITYQQIVVALVDDVAPAAGGTSLLPEGYELTLLLPCAEQFLKSRKNYPDVAMLGAELQTALAAFYDKYRTNKIDPVTDSNKQRRKVETDALQTVAR